MNKLIRFLLKKLKLWKPIIQRRIDLSNILKLRLGNRILYGPFKGMQLSDKKWWGQPDVGSIILGSHEQEVVTFLTAGSWDLFIDIGAADGYYAIGLIYSKYAKRCIAYETSEVGREVLKKTAVMNKVEKMIEIRGHFNQQEAEKLKLVGQEGCLILCDIEGGEYDLLTTPLLSNLNRCTIVVELHPFSVNSGYDKERQLLNYLKEIGRENFFINQGHRNPFAYKELEDFNEDDKWLLMSEGRLKQQRWLVIRPYERD